MSRRRTSLVVQAVQSSPLLNSWRLSGGAHPRGLLRCSFTQTLGAESPFTRHLSSTCHSRSSSTKVESVKLEKVWQEIQKLSSTDRRELSTTLWQHERLSHDDAEELDKPEKLFNQVDLNQDGNISRAEFAQYFTNTRRGKVLHQDSELDSKSQPGVSRLKLTRAQYRFLFLTTAIPFVGFGFLDNVIMLVAGDYIELTIGSRFHLSTLAAAALGNTFSDVAGIGLSGVIQNQCTKLGLPPPVLTPEQMAMSSTRVCIFLASASGITVGCLLGMCPLLFITTS